MAIYHLSVKTVARKEGIRAASRYKYIKRLGRYKADNAEVIFAIDGNMPKWAAGAPDKFWRAADLHERKNGRLFRQVEFALPIELSLPARQKAAMALTQAVTMTADGPLPYSMAIHAGHGRGNPHAHLILNERANDGVERKACEWFRRAGYRRASVPGARKSNILKPKDWLLWVRQTWEDIANAALEAEGLDVRIDCRTLEAQGIKRAPQKHLGPARAAMERKRKEAEEQSEQAQEQAYQDEAALNAMYYDDFENADLEARSSENEDEGDDPGHDGPTPCVDRP